MGCFSNSSYKILPLPYLLAVPGKESGEQGLQVLKGTHTRVTTQLFSEFSEVGHTCSCGGFTRETFWGSVFCSDFCSDLLLCYFPFSDWSFFCAALSNLEILQQTVWEAGGAPNPSCSSSAIAGIWTHGQIQLESTKNALIFSKTSTDLFSYLHF